MPWLGVGEDVLGGKDVRISLSWDVGGAGVPQGWEGCVFMTVCVNVCLSVDYATVVQYFMCILEVCNIPPRAVV